MKAKEFIYSRSQELAEAIDNGYDLRLSEPDILYWMEKYAEYKAKNLPIHNVVRRSEQLKVFDDLLDYAWDLAHLNEHYEKLNELKERF